MIGNRDHGYVFCAIQKAASLSIRHWLIANYAGKAIGKYHQFDIPDGWRDQRRFVCVRNPYARMWSLYWWRRWRRQSVSFEQMCEGYASGGNSQMALIERAAPDAIVRVEHLEADVRALWFHDSKLPPPGHKRATPKRPPLSQMSAEQCAIVADLFSSDFRGLGYSARLLPAGPSAPPAPRSE